MSGRITPSPPARRKRAENRLVLDNYATHKTALVQRWLLRHPRYHLHFTPTHASGSISPKPPRWQKTADEILASITRFADQ